MIKSIIKKFTPSFLLDFYYQALPFIGAFLYGFPSRPKGRGSPSGAARELIVIGITGTNGKSTVVDLTTRILEEAGYKTASLSSIRFKIGDREWPNTLKMTMPGRFRLQKFLRQAVDAGCQYAVLEVTSEGIKQHRHGFINFDVAVFTNLTPEHIESHGSFEKYREAKGKLFQIAKKVHVINLDDKNVEYFLQFPASKKYAYQVNDDQISIDGSPTPISLKLFGKFNLYNAAAAICVGLSQGVSLGVCQKALEKIEQIPGRMEIIIREPFTVIVDYAHTPDALEKVYQTIQGSKICVLGSAGGGRDKWKRPELGKIAGQYCDQIILTNEDPYDEPPEKIISDIKNGIALLVRPQQKCYIILDRREAIKKALSLAGSGDTVIITGKGCESWMCLAKGKKIPWDDRKVVREEL